MACLHVHVVNNLGLPLSSVEPQTTHRRAVTELPSSIGETGILRASERLEIAAVYYFKVVCHREQSTHEAHGIAHEGHIDLDFRDQQKFEFMAVYAHQHRWTGRALSFGAVCGAFPTPVAALRRAKAVATRGGDGTNGLCSWRVATEGSGVQVTLVVHRTDMNVRSKRRALLESLGMRQQQPLTPPRAGFPVAVAFPARVPEVVHAANASAPSAVHSESARGEASAYYPDDTETDHGGTILRRVDDWTNLSVWAGEADAEAMDPDTRDDFPHARTQDLPGRSAASRGDILAHSAAAVQSRKLDVNQLSRRLKTTGIVETISLANEGAAADCEAMTAARRRSSMTGALALEAMKAQKIACEAAMKDRDDVKQRREAAQAAARKRAEREAAARKEALKASEEAAKAFALQQVEREAAALEEAQMALQGNRALTKFQDQEFQHSLLVDQLKDLKQKYSALESEAATLAVKADEAASLHGHATSRLERYGGPDAANPKLAMEVSRTAELLVAVRERISEIEAARSPLATEIASKDELLAAIASGIP